MCDVKINIAIPTYNRARSLKEFFISNSWVLDNENYNVVILDNASTDETLKFCKEMTSRYTNIKFISNEVHVTAEENVKRAFRLRLGGHLWVMGDRYRISKTHAELLVDVSRESANDLLLLSLNNYKNKDNKCIVRPEHVILNKNIMLAASCISTGIYPQSLIEFAENELACHDSTFPQTYVIVRALIAGRCVKYLPKISVHSSSGDVNWAYTSNWIKIGFVGWFKLIDSIIPRDHPKIHQAYRAFPTNTSLGSFRGAIKRRMMNVINFNDIRQQRFNLIKGVGVIRFVIIALISTLPLNKIGKIFKMA